MGFPPIIKRLNDLDSGLTKKANATDVNTALALKANLASPALTGNPTAPTQAAGNNSTRIATTAFVAAALSNVSGGMANRAIITSSGTWTVPKDSVYFFTIIGGSGGAGGSPNINYVGGGGGAGGIMSFPIYLQSKNTLTLKVGAGGTGGGINSAAGTGSGGGGGGFTSVTGPSFTCAVGGGGGGGAANAGNSNGGGGGGGGRGEIPGSDGVSSVQTANGGGPGGAGGGGGDGGVRGVAGGSGFDNTGGEGGSYSSASTLGGALFYPNGVSYGGGGNASKSSAGAAGQPGCVIIYY